MTIDDLKIYLNIDADNSGYDGELQRLIDAALEDLTLATGKTFDTDNALVKQFVFLYCRREFDMLTDASVDNRLLDIQKKILLSVKFAEDTSNAQSN